MRVRVNDEWRELAEGTTVAELVAAVTAQPSVAVALNGTVVSRAAWSLTTVPDGAEVHILTAVPGG